MLKSSFAMIMGNSMFPRALKVGIKLNLGELIMVLKVLQGNLDRWSTVHRFNEIQTSISIAKHVREFWINVDKYAKNLWSPEIDILCKMLDHVINEKIVRATVVPTIIIISTKLTNK